MPAVACPIPGCAYVTDDLDAAIVAALITAHSTTHAQGPITAAKINNIRRPVITAAGTSEDWAYFLSRWSDYVEATKVTGRDRVLQLLECCDEQLRKDLTRSTGGRLTDKPVLAAIQRLAVRQENTMVARVTLHNMPQDRDEPIRAFGARLSGQAGVCKFIVPCPAEGCGQEVNYTDAILRDALTRGIADPDIQLDLLSDKNQDMTLEDVFQFVEAKEAGKRSASRLLDSHTAEAATNSLMVDAAASAYKRNRRYPAKDNSELCSYCGKPGHGTRSVARIRKTECPAYTHRCSYCKRDHHFEHVCRSKDKQRNTSDAAKEICEGATFETLCTVSASVRSRQSQSISIDHHLFDNLSKTWIKKSSLPQPFVNLTIKASRRDFQALGFPLSTPSNL